MDSRSNPAAAPISTPPTASLSVPEVRPVKSSPFSLLVDNPVGSIIKDGYNAFSERREALGLPNPGTLEQISREVTRDVFLNGMMFSGFRADFSKTFSTSPMFQTAHNFTMGTQGMPPYGFAVIYGSPKVFLQGNFDSEYTFMGRANYRIFSGLTAKSLLQIAPGEGQSMLQLEADYTGADFSANIKGMNPSLIEGGLTGMMVGSYLQSVTPRLALGLEALWQRTAGDQGPDTMVSYAARYKGDDWIGSAQLLAQGSIQASYWRRLAERVEAGLDINLQFLGLSGAGAMMGMGMPKNEGVATMGIKYDFRTSVFRGQLDTTGKVSAVLEKRIAPSVSITFAGEMDHAKNSTKMGMAVSLEGVGSDEAMEQQERLMAAAENAPPPPF